MTFLSVFSGIGGLDLGLEHAGMTCVGQVEIDPFCRAVLAKHWPNLFRWSDVTDLPVELIRFACGPIDALAGGFACQDVSAAGKGAGIGRQTRSGLTWRNLFRLARGLRPTWLIIENVPALRSRGADRVLRALERIGYTCWAWLVGARDVRAPHKRQRVFIVANRLSHGLGGIHGEAGRWQDGPEQRAHVAREGDQGMADAIGERRGAGRGVARDETGEGQWGSESEGSSELADSTLRGQRADGFTQRGPGHADQRGAGVGLADTRSEGLEGRRPLSGGAGAELAMPASGNSNGGIGHSQGTSLRQWPARPGQQQHEWEAPRLVEFPLGGDLDGVPVRLVRFANRNGLKAYGNAVVPACAEVIGRAILANGRASYVEGTA